MKFKVLSCLLAASVMFSAQPITVVNSTAQEITLCNFGHSEESLNILADSSPVTLLSHKKFHTKEPYTLVTILINQKYRRIENLNPDSMVIVSQADNDIYITIDSDGPFVFNAF